MDQQIQLGKYRLYHHLASGGMGEVFLARHEGPAGFAKNVVVKRILSGIASDETFVTMFLNEARLAAMIEHPNVVQIFDLGLEGDTYFIAMEYIHGRSLRQLRRRLAEVKRPFPALLAARICSQALQGLHYAHNLCDDEGQHLQIVHRDVSPDNVLIGFNGVTKVVDFGIAKAAVNVSTTRAGAVKGKFAYMAPEQITGKPLDGRADVYATGVLLYELLSGQRPFSASSEPGLIRAILQEPATPAREANPAIPEPLNDVIMRAIARKPDERFASAEEMSFALESFIQSTGKTITNAHVAALMKDLFPDDAAHKTPASAPTPPPRQASYGLTPPPGSLPPGSGARSAVSVIGTPGSGSAPVPRTVTPAPAIASAVHAPTPAPFSAVSMPPAPPASAIRSVPFVASGEASLPDIEILVDGEEKASSRPRRKVGVIAAAVGGAALLAGAALVLMPGDAETPPAASTQVARPAQVAAPSPSTATSAVPAPEPKPRSTALKPTPESAVESTPEPREVTFDEAPSAVAAAQPASDSAEAAPEPKPVRRTRQPTRRQEKAARPVQTRAEAPPVAEAEVEIQTGRVMLRVNPWAEVYWSGRSMGITPMDAVELPAGKQVLTLRNEDLSLERKIAVNVIPGSEVVVKADLLD